MFDSEKTQGLEEQAALLLQADRVSLLPELSGTLLLHVQNPNLGQLLCAERAVFYLNILYGLLLFRRNHELEPLHEDVYHFVLAAQQQASNDDDYDTTTFGNDIRQLENWELISKRIERERLRGYKDTRRRKFRYRIADQTLSFLQWLEDQLREALEPQLADTRDLLEEVAGGLRETQRVLNKMHQTEPDPEKARSAIYRLGRLGHLTLDINRSLADFNARLIAFSLDRYDTESAQAILGELEHFLEKYLNRILILRREIVPELEKLRSPRYRPRWELCRSIMTEEIRHSAHLMRSRTIPEALPELDRLIRFYEIGGQLDQLCARVRTSARNVWRKLYTHLRELERKSHRMEDLKDRIREMAQRPPDQSFAPFIQELIAPARIIGDMNYWDAAEKADPPQPRFDQHAIKQTPVNYLKEKKKSDTAIARSLNEERLLQLKSWIEQTHPDLPAGLSQGNYTEFDDLPRLLELARNGLLGNGKPLSKVGLHLQPTPDPTTIELQDIRLAFNELMLAKTNEAAP